MFIPIGTDRLPKRRIIITPVLIGLNLLAFVGMLMLDRTNMASLDETIAMGSISWNTLGSNPLRLLSYQFLHSPGGLGHIGFNMLFLWVFGQAVESRLGAIGFAVFYLAGGVFAGLAHVLVSQPNVPCIGASGSIAAVSGAFLMLFPRTTIRVLLFFFIIGFYHIPAMWFIGLYIALDLINQFTDLLGYSRGNVAYGAHLGGYFFGFTVAMILLATKILPRTDMDLLYLFKQARRRRVMRQVTKESAGIWDTNASATVQTGRKPRHQPASHPVDPHAEEKNRISGMLRNHQGEEAVAAYLTLLDQNIKPMFSDADQLDLANRLFASGKLESAADAYQALLDRTEARGQSAGSKDDIRLLLGSILVRRLNRPRDAGRVLAEINESKLDAANQALLTALKAETGNPS